MTSYSLSHRARLMAPLASLLLLLSIPARAGDVFFYIVAKGQIYEQSSTNAPDLALENPYVFEAIVEGTGNGEIYSADLTKPGSSASAIPSTGTYSFYARVVFSSLNGMNSLYRSGTYRFDFDSENDFFTVAYVSLSDDTYPPTPHVVNYAAAQAVNAATNFTVQWDAFSGGTVDDVVELYVYDETDAVVYTDSGLDGTAKSDTIPANTLVAGKTYRGEVIFRKSVDAVVDNSGAVGLSFYNKFTRFSVATTGSSGNNPAPTMSNLLLQQGGQFQFHVQGVAGRSYRIESSADFLTWTPLQTLMAPAGGGIDFTESVGPGLKFYRVALLPP